MGSSAAKNPLEDVQLIPAISDAGGPLPIPYEFQFDKGEAEERQKQMTDLAKQELQVYLQKQAKAMEASIEPTSKSSKTGQHRKTTPKVPQLELENVQMRVFDLWGNNQPVLVLSAEAQAPKSAKSTDSAGPMRYYVTLVARTDIYSNLHKLYAGITDKYHLDVTPQLELIDAVDADGDGNGELLFREISDVGSGYVIYRAAADTLWKEYDSLNPS